MKVWFAAICCAIVALQVGSSPLGRVKRAIQGSADITVTVPGRFRESKRFAWNVADGLSEIGPNGTTLPAGGSRSEAISEDEEDIQPGGFTTPPGESEEDIQPGGRIPPSPRESEEDIQPGGRIPPSPRESEEDIQPGGRIPPFPRESEEDIQPGGRIPPSPRESEEDIQPGGRIPPSPRESEEDIQPGGFVYPKAAPEPKDTEEDIQSTSSSEEEIESPEEMEPAEGPLATLIGEAAANLEAVNAGAELNNAAEEVVASSVPVVAQAKIVAEVAPTLPEPERPLPLPPVIETEISPELAKSSTPVAPPAPDETEEDILRRKRESEPAPYDSWEFQQEARDHFNLFRDRVGMPKVTLDDELSAGAQAWADHMMATKSTEMSDCEECAYIETFAHKTVLGSRRDVPTGGAAADWVITRWFTKAADNSEDPYSKALLRHESISKMGIGAAYSRVGDRKEMYIVARFE